MNDKCGPTLHKHGELLAQHVIEINSINHSINVFNRLLQELTQKTQELDALNCLHQKFEDHKRCIADQCMLVGFHVESLKKECSCLKDKSAQAESSYMDTCRRLESLKECLEEIRKSFDAKASALANHMDHVVSSSKDNLQSEVCKLRSDIDVSPCTIVKQNSLVDKSNEAIRISEQAKEVSERVGIEIKILNRKMNEILEKLKS